MPATKTTSPSYKSIFILAMILFVTAVTTVGQSYYFKKYKVENGLSNNATICCIQDRKGFLWFGTKDGLNRFDGYSFKVFRNDPDDAKSIGSNFIHCLYEDKNGILWVGTQSGLYKYDSDTESFTSLAGTENDWIRDIIMDDRGIIWFVSGLTVFKYDDKKGNPVFYDIDNYFEATSLCKTLDGSLWVSTTSGLLEKYNYNNNTFSGYDVFDHSNPSVARWIEKIYATRNGTILIGTSNQGAKIFDVSNFSYKDILTYNTDGTELFVRNFIQTSESEFWIATESGIYVYNTITGKAINLRKKFNDTYSISDNAVYTFCTDKEGGIWAGTYFGGINYFPKDYNVFTKYLPRTRENSISGNVVREIKEDGDGNLWIGTEDAGLIKLDIESGRFLSFFPDGKAGSISYSNIHGLLVCGNELWVGTFEHGLDVLNIKTGKAIRHYNAAKDEHALKSNFIYCLTKTDAGQIMIGTTRGAYSYNRKSNDFSILPGMPLNNWYSSLLVDHNGIIWAGTYGNGVNYYNTKTNRSGNFRYNAKDKSSICSDRVNSIFEDSDNNLWIATEGGLCRFNPQTNNFNRYKKGFPGNFILSILEDDQKHLWISTSKGLVQFSPAGEVINVYTKENGVLNDQFNFNSAYKDKHGKMYFGSVEGMISFYPNDVKENQFTPPIYITGFQVDNKELLINDANSPLKKSITSSNEITLKYNQSSFSIDFAALGYTAPHMTEYAYKLQGLDKDWTYLKQNRKAYFTKLATGNYIFKVRATNSSGVWNKDETILMIHILPPWWASWWAYGIYFIASIGLVYYLFNAYHNRTVENNKRKMEMLEAAKEKEIFKAKMEFFTNIAHEIRTPLTFIKGPLEKVIEKAGSNVEIKDSLKLMDRNTNRLVTLTNQLLDFRKVEIDGFRLNFVKVNVTELVEENFVNFKELASKKNLVYKILAAPAIFAFADTEALNKILSNLIGNAVKYSDTTVLVELPPFNEKDLFFTVKIKNDGYLIPLEMKEKIFEPFFRLKETKKQKGTGIGLALARSLTELHNGVLELKEPEIGLNVFVLTLPVRQENEFNFLDSEQEITISKDANI